MNRTVFTFAVLLLISFAGFAVNPNFNEDDLGTGSSDKLQSTTDSLSVEISANLQARHVWRGQLSCNAWNIQPSFDVSKNNFLVGAWAAYTVDNSYAEVDLYVSYTYKRFTLSLLDYFCPDETRKFNRFFNFKQSTAQHTIDAELRYNGTEDFPLTVSVSSLLWGQDLNPKPDERFLSTYIEAAYSWSVSDDMEVDAFAGLTPFKGYYADSFNVIALGAGVTQKVKITDNFNFPVFGKLVLNPYTENLYFVFGVTMGIRR